MVVLSSLFCRGPLTAIGCRIAVAQDSDLDYVCHLIRCTRILITRATYKQLIGKKKSEQELFAVPARFNLGVNLVFIPRLSLSSIL